MTAASASSSATPASAPVRRRALAGAAAVVIGLGGWAGFTGLMSHDLVRPRNAVRPAPEEPPADVDRVLRVEVGPPAATLSAWVVEPPPDAARGPLDVVLVLHGIADSKRSMAGLGSRIAAAGMRAVLVDLRGHGESSVTTLSYGVFESRDLSRLLDRLERDDLLHGDVGVYGPSYGGAVALQLAGRDPRVTRVVTVGAFASMREIVGPYFRSEAPWISWAIPEVWTQHMVDRAAARGGFDADDASPVDAVRHTRARILLMHGEHDDIVPFTHARAIANACGSRCRLVMLPGMDHRRSLSNAMLREQMMAWLTAPQLD